MVVTLIAFLEIVDRDALDAYRAKAGDALAKHGGRVVKAGPIAETMEGDFSAHTAAILEFPDDANATAWLADPDLASVHATRNSAGKSTVIRLG